MTSPTASLAEQQAVLVAIEALEADKARLHARSLALRAEAGRLWAAERSGFAEIELAGTALIGQIRAARELDDAARVSTCFPGLAELLAAGAIFVPTADLMLQATRRCRPEVQAAVDARLSPQLVGMNVTDARRLIRHTVLSVEAEIDADLTRERLDAARQDARVWVSPGADGMTSVGAILDAIVARRWALDFDVLVRAQRSLDSSVGTERTREQVRAHVFAGLPGLVLELIRAARDGRLPELCALDPATTERLTCELERLADDTRDLPLPERQTDVRLETDPFDLVAVAALDPTAAQGWEPGEPPADDPPEPPPHPRWEVVGDAALHNPGLQATLLRCLRMPLPNPVTVHLHLPMATALDRTDAPGILEGHGPLDAYRIRQLLPDARLREVYVDAGTGVPLGAEATAAPPRAGQAHPDQLAQRLRPVTLIDRPEPRHDPSAGLAAFVKLRDQHCPGPGCTMPASRCDLDHELPHPQGPTAEWNLQDKSRRCHTAKHAGWTVTRHPDGRTEWISPIGRRYISRGPWPAPPRPAVAGYQLHLPNPRLAVELELRHAA